MAGRAVGIAANRWHEVERLGCSETGTASDAALGYDSHTLEAREASTVNGSSMAVSGFQMQRGGGECWQASRARRDAGARRLVVSCAVYLE